MPSGVEKTDGFIAFFPCPGSGLASRAALRVKNRPTCRSQGSSRRSGRFPALPYPPLKGCFPFPLPWGSIGGERETAGVCKTRLS
jgi:hypothetical protein